MATAIGHGFGVTLYALMTVSGLGILVAELPPLYTTIKLVGAVYLLWLAYLSWHAGQSTGHRLPPGRAGFMRGALVALLNPKLAIFMLALFSQFLDADAGLAHAAILIATAGGIDTLWYTTIVLAAGTATVQRGLARITLALHRIFALLLTALALWVIASTV